MTESVQAYTVSSTVLQPVLDAFNSSLTNLMPVGITIMATLVGIHMIKRVWFMFF